MLSLIVRLDRGEGVFHPSVQIRGEGERRDARIRLELIDRLGATRLTVERAFPADALNAELSLRAFTPPDGATPDEVLAWRWDVVLSGDDGELRWQEHPSAAGQLNHEAELSREELGTGAAPVRRPFAAPPEGEGIEFELGCLSGISYSPSASLPGRTVTTPNYLRRAARVARPAAGTRRASVTCATCGRGLALGVASRKVVLCRRLARLAFAAALIAYIVVMYSGPTGHVSAIRALLLTAAFVGLFVAPTLLFRALFADDVALGLKIAEDPGSHRLFSGASRT